MCWLNWLAKGYIKVGKNLLWGEIAAFIYLFLRDGKIVHKRIYEPWACWLRPSLCLVSLLLCISKHLDCALLCFCCGWRIRSQSYAETQLCVVRLCCCGLCNAMRIQTAGYTGPYMVTETTKLLCKLLCFLTNTMSFENILPKEGKSRFRADWALDCALLC